MGPDGDGEGVMAPDAAHIDPPGEVSEGEQGLPRHSPPSPKVKVEPPSEEEEVSIKIFVFL